MGNSTKLPHTVQRFVILLVLVISNVAFSEVTAQTQSGAPRFRSPYPPVSRQRQLQRRPPPRRRVTREQIERARAEARAASSHRARQALWHAQSKRERLASAELYEDELQPMAVGPHPRYSTHGGSVEGGFVDGGYVEDGFVDGGYVEGDVFEGDMIEGEVLPGEPVWQPTWQHGEVWDGDGHTCESCGEWCDGYCDGCGAADCCGEYGCCGGGYRFGGRRPSLPWLFGLGNLSVFAGVQGFTNPVNQGSTGSFGFHEGMNFGTYFPLFPRWGLGWQAGFRTLQSNLSGSMLTNDDRQQTFFTTGLFKRTEVGLQGGLVIDFLRDHWAYDIDVTQIRGEFSYRFPHCHEWGYSFSASGVTDTTTRRVLNDTAVELTEWEPTDLHRFFYRRRLCWCPGGTTSFFFGFTGSNDGLIGANTYLPFNGRFALDSSFTYLVPDEPSSAGGTVNEAWNVSLALVWNLRCNGPCRESVFTPLLPVADNGTFILDLVRSSVTTSGSN